MSIQQQHARHVVITTFFLLLVIIMPGCGASKVLKEPAELVIQKPLVSNSDAHLEVHLDWVIFRDGPGTWASNANWDQYLLRVQNLGDEKIRITGVTLYDSLDTPVEATANLDKLTKMSRETTKRYKEDGFKVKAGVSGDALAVAGGAVVLAGVVAANTSASAAYAFAYTGGMSAVVWALPLFYGAGLTNRTKARVEQEMIKQSTPMPSDLYSKEQQNLTFFFPLAPSPLQLDLAYENSGGAHLITLDTSDVLQGLHIVRAKK